MVELAIWIAPCPLPVWLMEKIPGDSEPIRYGLRRARLATDRHHHLGRRLADEFQRNLDVELARECGEDRRGNPVEGDAGTAKSGQQFSVRAKR